MNFCNTSLGDWDLTVLGMVNTPIKNMIYIIIYRNIIQVKKG